MIARPGPEEVHVARDDEFLRLLAQIPLFSACNKKELRAIGRLGTPYRASEGEVLATEGKPGSEFFVIVSGNARVSLNGRKISDLDVGGFFGELALLDRGPRVATVTALTDMWVRVFDAREFVSLLETSPTVARKLLRGVAERLRAAMGGKIEPN